MKLSVIRDTRQSKSREKYKNWNRMRHINKIYMADIFVNSLHKFSFILFSCSPFWSIVECYFLFFGQILPPLRSLAGFWIINERVTPSWDLELLCQGSEISLIWAPGVGSNWLTSINQHPFFLLGCEFHYVYPEIISYSSWKARGAPRRASDVIINASQQRIWLNITRNTF